MPDRVNWIDLQFSFGGFQTLYISQVIVTTIYECGRRLLLLKVVAGGLVQQLFSFNVFCTRLVNSAPLDRVRRQENEKLPDIKPSVMIKCVGSGGELNFYQQPAKLLQEFPS